MSTLGHTPSLTFQNLTELISPLNYPELTWLNGEKRETELEQGLEEIENFPNSFFFLTCLRFLSLCSWVLDALKWNGHDLFNPFCSITDVWQILRLKSLLTNTYLKTFFLFTSFNKRMVQPHGFLLTMDLSTSFNCYAKIATYSL